MKLSNVTQGSANVISANGTLLGSVERRYGNDSHAGWYAYNCKGKRISEYPNPKRIMAVREVVEARS